MVRFPALFIAIELILSCSFKVAVIANFIISNEDKNRDISEKNYKLPMKMSRWPRFSKILTIILSSLLKCSKIFKTD